MQRSSHGLFFSPVSISKFSLAPFVDAAPGRCRADSAISDVSAPSHYDFEGIPDDESDIVTPWLTPQFKMGQEFTVEHGRGQYDTQHSDSCRSTDLASEDQEKEWSEAMSGSTLDTEDISFRHVGI